MKIIEKTIVGMLCLIIASCTNQEVTSIVSLTNAPLATSTPSKEIPTIQTTPTLAYEEIGYFPTYIARWRFYKWRLSFTLPRHWITSEHFNIVKAEHYFDLERNEDNFTFFSQPFENSKREKSVAEIRFRFQNIPEGLNPKNFSKTDWELCKDNGFQIEEVIMPEKIGNDLFNSVLYKCNLSLENVAEQSLYVIHANHVFYKDIGIEIIMIANADVFQIVEKEFVEFMKSLSFEQ